MGRREADSHRPSLVSRKRLAGGDGANLAGVEIGLRTKALEPFDHGNAIARNYAGHALSPVMMIDWQTVLHRRHRRRGAAMSGYGRQHAKGA
jgi:hypothetical protein